MAINQLTEKTLKRLPRFKGAPLATVDLLNYFQPVETPREVLDRMYAMREVTTVNPLTGVVKIESYFAISRTAWRGDSFMSNDIGENKRYFKWNVRSMQAIWDLYPELKSPTNVPYIWTINRTSPKGSYGFSDIGTRMPCSMRTFGVESLLRLDVSRLTPLTKHFNYKTEIAKDIRTLHGDTDNRTLACSNMRVVIPGYDQYSQFSTDDILDNIKEYVIPTLNIRRYDSSNVPTDYTNGVYPNDFWIEIITNNDADHYQVPHDDNITFYKCTVEFTVSANIFEYYERLVDGTLWSMVALADKTREYAPDEIRSYIYKPNTYNSILFNDELKYSRNGNGEAWKKSTMNFNEYMVSRHGDGWYSLQVYLAEYQNNDRTKPRVKETRTSQWEDLWDWIRKKKASNSDFSRFIEGYGIGESYYLANYNPYTATVLQYSELNNFPRWWDEEDLRYPNNSVFRNIINRNIPANYTVTMKGWEHIFKNWTDDATTDYDVGATTPYLLNSQVVIQNLYYNGPIQTFKDPNKTKRYFNDEGDDSELWFPYYYYQSNRRLLSETHYEDIDSSNSFYKFISQGEWDFNKYLKKLKNDNRKVEYYWWWSYITVLAQGEIKFWYKFSDYDYQGPIVLKHSEEDSKQIIEDMKAMNLKYGDDATNKRSIAQAVLDRINYIPRDHTCTSGLFDRADIRYNGDYSNVLPNQRAEDIIGIRTDNYNSGGLNTSQNRNTKPVNIMPIKKYHPDQVCYGITHNVIEHAKRNFQFNPGNVKRAEILVSFHPWAKVNDRRAAAIFAIIDNTDGFTAPLYQASV